MRQRRGRILTFVRCRVGCGPRTVAGVNPIRRLWRSRHAVDLVLWVVVSIPVLVEQDPLPSGAWLSMPAFQLVAIGLLAMAIPVSRRTPMVAAAMPGLIALVTTGVSYSAQLLLAQIVLAFLLGRRTGGRWASIGLLIVLGTLALAYAVVGMGGSPSGWFSMTSNALGIVVLPWAVGQYVRQLAELRDAGWELAERLEREQSRATAQARLRERARIASDMHDSLGHELSLIAVRAAALEVTPDIGADGRRAAGDLRLAAESATEQLRDIIGMLRADGDDPPIAPSGTRASTVATVRSLVERAGQSGLTVTLVDSIGDDDGTIPEATSQAVYRVVQEALTNAAKHAPGAAATVALGASGERVVVEVSNEAGSGEPSRAGDGGYGLVGLDERVRLVGGSLEAGPTQAGFVVRARLPLGRSTVAAPVSGPAAHQALEAARGRLRRGVVGALWPPVAWCW